VDLNVSDASKNMNKFYRMQVVESNDKKQFWFVQHWGRTGTSGQTQVKGPTSKDSAIKLLMAKFKQKSKKSWADRGSAGPGTGDSSARGGKGTYELTARLQAAGAKMASVNGAVAISLMWLHDTKEKNDLDLWVTAPSGERIGFNHKKSKCGGHLDVDRRMFDAKPVENIVWTKNAPAGNYKVEVHNYDSNHQKPKKFTVGIVQNGGKMKLLNKATNGKEGVFTKVAAFKYTRK